jgi:hypothetical protein
VKPGNAGGGKAPYFWSAFEEDETGVSGLGLIPPEKVRTLQIKLYLEAKLGDRMHLRGINRFYLSIKPAVLRVP